MIRSVIAVLAAVASHLASADAVSSQDPATTKSKVVDSLQISVRGRVLDDHFAPAEGIPIVHVIGKTPDVRAALKSPIAESDATGRFSAQVTIDPKQPNGLLLGGRKFAIRRYRLRKSVLEVDLGTFAMPRGFFATGRIRTADGKPLKDAVVVGSDLLDTREFLSQSRYRGNTKCWTCAPVPASGIFMLPGMVRSAGELVVRCPGYYNATIAPVAMGTPLDITLHPAELARGRVVDANGTPLANISVAIGSARTKSAADGSWSVFRRTRGTKTARAWSHRGGNYRSASTTLSDDGTPCEIELDLEPAKAKNAKSLRVRAVNQDGDPIEKFDAFISWNPNDQLRYRPDAFLIGGASRDDKRHKPAVENEAALPGPESPRDDTGILFVHAEGHAWTRVEVEPDAVGGKPIVAKLAPPLAVAGKVLDKANDKPLANVNIVVTPKADDHTRQLFSQGFWKASDMLGPFSVKTGPDGRWSAQDLTPGEYDVFVMLGGKIVHTIDTFDLKNADAAKKLQAIDCKIGTIKPLRGTIEGAASWLEIRPHWHRRDMSSSSWNTEYEGAVPIADDGTFLLPDLAPLTWRPEILQPVPPRGGLRRKLHCKIWDGANPPEKPYRVTAPTIIKVAGRVGGEIPWHRLGVLASMQQENHFHNSFAPPGTIAVLAPDRTFRIQLPEATCRLILFDVYSGVALAWRDVEAEDLAKPVNWSGKAVPLAIDARTDSADDVQKVKFTYQPDEDHWPMPVHQFNNNNGRTGMTATFLSDAIPQLWLPARSGTITFEHDQHKTSMDAGRIGNGRVELLLEATAIKASPIGK